jgi:hypothetical protein
MYKKESSGKNIKTAYTAPNAEDKQNLDVSGFSFINNDEILRIIRFIRKLIRKSTSAYTVASI